jgi:hypothetical protein
MEVNVYEAIPVLRKVLVTRYFSLEAVGLGRSWFDNKTSLFAKYGLRASISQEDVDLMNKGIRHICEKLESLKLPVEEPEYDLESRRNVSMALQELRQFINLPYFYETYIEKISMQTFRCKICISPMKNGSPFLFNKVEIREVSKGINELSEMFSSMFLVL